MQWRIFFFVFVVNLIVLCVVLGPHRSRDGEPDSLGHVQGGVAVQEALNASHQSMSSTLGASTSTLLELMEQMNRVHNELVDLGAQHPKLARQLTLDLLALTGQLDHHASAFVDNRAERFFRTSSELLIEDATALYESSSPTQWVDEMARVRASCVRCHVGLVRDRSIDLHALPAGGSN